MSGSEKKCMNSETEAVSHKKISHTIQLFIFLEPAQHLCYELDGQSQHNDHQHLPAVNKHYFS